MLNILKFVDESKSELKKVTWPTKKEALNLTYSVIFITFFVIIFISLSDYILNKLIGLLIK